MFKDAYRGKRRKEKPNRMRSQPTLSFRTDLAGDTLYYLQRLKNGKERSKFINEAIRMKHFYDCYRKGFLLQLMEYNYYICKHLLRQIGSARREFQNREANSKGLNTKERKKNAK